MAFKYPWNFKKLFVCHQNMMVLDKNLLWVKTFLKFHNFINEKLCENLQRKILTNASNLMGLKKGGKK